MSAEDQEPSSDIWVLERTRIDYRWQQSTYRRAFEQWTEDGAFARWLADPKSGRFVVLDLHADTVESAIWNLETERELFDLVGEKIFAHTRQVAAGERDQALEIGIIVTPEVEAKLRQMRAEISAILEGREGEN